MPNKKKPELSSNLKVTSRLTMAIILVASLGMTAALLADTALAPQERAVNVFAGPENRGTLHIRGAVFALKDHEFASVGEIVFVVAIAEGQEPVNFAMTEDSNADGSLSDEPMPLHMVVISYVDQYQRVDDLVWRFTEHGPGDGDNLLEVGENFRITVGADTGRSNLLDDVLKVPLGANTAFTIEVKTPDGAVLDIHRATPDRLDAVMNLN
jgi:archaellin